MIEEMTEDQANAIIDTMLGLSRDHTQRLEIAQRASDILAEAVKTLRGMEK